MTWMSVSKKYSYFSGYFFRVRILLSIDMITSTGSSMRHMCPKVCESAGGFVKIKEYIRFRICCFTISKIGIEHSRVVGACSRRCDSPTVCESVKGMVCRPSTLNTRTLWVTPTAYHTAFPFQVQPSLENFASNATFS